MKISWYINRLTTMSLPEIVYRTRQYFNKKREKRNSNIIKDIPFKQLFNTAISKPKFEIPINYLEEYQTYRQYSFFGLTIDLFQDKVSWHFDPLSNKYFPTDFSKDINIRTDEFGNAKVVWELNRLQFLLPLALRFRCTGDDKDLNQWINLLDSWIDANPYLVGVN